MVYGVIFVIRLVTWALDQGVSNNRILIVTNYFYSLNTLLLTFRPFGHLMESRKGLGGIQIALFKILGDIAGIFWQFLAAILAFSFAITKVYVAEGSFVKGRNITSRLVLLYRLCIYLLQPTPSKFVLFCVSVYFCPSVSISVSNFLWLTISVCLCRSNCLSVCLHFSLAVTFVNLSTSFLYNCIVK